VERFQVEKTSPLKETPQVKKKKWGGFHDGPRKEGDALKNVTLIMKTKRGGRPLHLREKEKKKKNKKGFLQQGEKPAPNKTATERDDEAYLRKREKKKRGSPLVRKKKRRGALVPQSQGSITSSLEKERGRKKRGASKKGRRFPVRPGLVFREKKGGEGPFVKK